MDRTPSRSRDATFHARGLAVLLASLALLAGCASSATVAFSKAGVTPADRERDENTCLRESIGHKDGVAILLPFDVDRDAYQRGMQAKGYTVAPAK